MSWASADLESKPGRLPYPEAVGTLRRVAAYLSAWKARFVLAGVILVVQSGLALAPALAVKSFIDQLTRQHPDIARLLVLALGAGAATLLAAILATVARLILVRVMQSVAARLRANVFEHLMRQSFAYHERIRPGELTSVLMNDIGGIAEGMSGTAPDLVRGCITIIIALVVMFIVSWPLAFVTLLVFPVGILAFRVISQAVYRARGAAQQQLGAVTAFIQEALGVSGLMLIRSFGQVAWTRERFNALNAELMSREVTVERTAAWLLFGGSVVLIIGPVVVITTGGLLVAHHDLTLGALVEFAAVVMALFMPALHGVSSGAAVLLGSTALWARAFAVLDQTHDIVESPSASPLNGVRGEIVLSEVTFTYPGQERPALDDVSLAIAPGKLVALVGPSGAGKSTLVSLLARFVDPQRGTVTIDGRDVRDITTASLCDVVGVSLQDTFLFHSSIRENLLIGKLDATDAELDAAVDAAQLTDLIARLPSGYDTIVGERGYMLSGGERQRVALARLLLKDPPIMILDEATSQLDSASEQLIQRALHQILRHRTGVVIAHRLSTVRAADVIVVLDEGRVVESGVHETLLERGGLYAQLHRIQFRA